MAGGYAIECDVQLSRDGEAMVFHDAALGRLTEASEAVASPGAAELATLAVAGTAERIPTLGRFLAEIGGRHARDRRDQVAVLGDLALTQRVVEVVSA